MIAKACKFCPLAQASVMVLRTTFDNSELSAVTAGPRYAVAGMAKFLNSGCNGGSRSWMQFHTVLPLE